MTVTGASWDLSYPRGSFQVWTLQAQQATANGAAELVEGQAARVRPVWPIEAISLTG
ncbi:hypothetical protein SAZ_37535 [Streptomyces noursei ZPM]|uniref:Uncharacterized protein n=1 Tax=Streptomyces noursei TaxID=1971 RepID=A0A059WD52_STRNR|nr:hypothetical protein DC74_7237 [Streptomyces noursei]AKA09109.1 hypothetical protein SAZ_37535 [Streptomyces noursei ZPM]EPY93625.1 hypothetical protein K530_47140 [Streptomyces noursei CCRC 11814]GCB95399.1 hypothetical protein SALB_08203 [Streptomyces noursei]